MINLKKITENKINILMYHGVIKTPLPLFDNCFVDEAMFYRQIKYLKKHFNLVKLSDAVNLLKNGNLCSSTAVITFDDGYKNNYDIAFPILQKENVPATVFLVTGLVDTNNTIWTCYIQHAISSTKKTHLNWAGQRYNLINLAQKKFSAEAIKEKLKEMPHAQMKSELNQMILELDVNPNHSFENSTAYRMLNSYDVKVMVDSGLIEFGAHSNSHAILSHLSYDEQKEEIRSSITAVQKMTGKKCTLFAFPNGSEKDFNDDTIDILNSSGIISSVTSIEGYNKITTPIMKLKRHGISYGMGMIKFKLLVHEFISILKKTEKMDL